MAKLGDLNANPLDHGGFLVFIDEAGIYPPEAEIVSPLEDGDLEWETFRFELNRCTFQREILSDNPYHPQQPAWFAGDLTEVARTCGWTLRGLKLALCHESVYFRACAYMALVAFFGPRAFDNTPCHWAPQERETLEARYTIEVPQ